MIVTDLNLWGLLIYKFTLLQLWLELACVHPPNRMQAASCSCQHACFRDTMIKRDYHLVPAPHPRPSADR